MSTSGPKNAREEGGGRLLEGRLLDGRWVVGEPIGRGGFGAVFAGRDALTGADVALKVLRADGLDPQALAREAGALRLLRVEGVVRLLDVVRDGDARVLVMERAPGAPFPGPGAGRAWADLERPTRRLLAILARVHAAGLVHLDLKPGNVLVDAAGEPRVLDLGLAAGRAFSPWDAGERSGSGTPRYAAPEQFLGRAPDARADLYALGAMLHEALCGQAPFEEVSDTDTFRERRLGETPPRPDVDAPAHVVDLLLELLAPEPSLRPRSARDVLDRLGRRTTAAPVDLGAGPLDARALERLFRGPDRLLHLREDAAAELLARTGGDPDRAGAELGAWVDAGLATWDGDRLALSRRDLLLLRDERVAAELAAAEPTPAGHARRADALAPGDDRRFVHLVLAGRRAEAPAEALATARRLAAEGRAEEALVVLYEGLSVLEEEGDSECGVRPVDLLEPAALAALAAQDEGELAVLAARLPRFAADDARVAALAALLEGAAAALGTDGERALARLDEAAALDHPELEGWRLMYRAVAARQASPAVEERELARLEAMLERADSDDLRRRSADLRGRRLYRCSRFEESARAHLAAIELARSGRQRLTATLLAASAWLEAGEAERARATAEAAAAEAAEHRLVTLEAHATWLARTAAYRAGRLDAPDGELLEALESLGHPAFASQLRFHEAVLAWRAGDRDLARDLARRCEREWRERGHGVPADLARLLAAECGVAPGADELEALCARADDVADPSLRAQLGGLCARRGAAVRAPWQEALAALDGPDERRWEVLSLGELRAALGVSR